MKRILLDSRGECLRAALVEEDRLIDLVVDKKKERSITGNVYLGVVKNILPTQFAFIDIGQPKNGFLNTAERIQPPPRMGQNILVQVRKDPSGDKGACLSRQISVTGRLSVLIGCGCGEIGVSHKIKDANERERLKLAAQSCLPKGFSVILRTNCEHRCNGDIFADIEKQVGLYNSIIEKGPYQKPPALVYQQNSLLHDFLCEDVSEIVVGDPAFLASAEQEARKCLPNARIRAHEPGTPLFCDAIERQISRALDRKVWLNCGGFLIIEQTEACVIIDVNTGKFTGSKSHGESVLRANMEAAVEIAVQIRLRNLSGMIIIDFINMDSREDARKLYRFFSEAIARDRVKTNIIGMTELGLMQLTRKKTRECLSRIMLRECPHCRGAGVVKA